MPSNSAVFPVRIRVVVLPVLRPALFEGLRAFPERPSDVSRYAGRFEHVFETTVAGVTLQAPQLDISTVAAGGGSRLAFRAGLFAVGPESAGAVPGPVCYRRQGGVLAVTDANLLLGRLVPDAFPAIFGPNGDQPLDECASRAAFASLTSL